MEEYHQITIQEYLDWKEDLRRRLAEAANNFVGIGYRLKQIRDSKGYEQDGYTSVFDFAAQEFGISTSQASRFMAINDKFSKGGNSLEMPEEYTKLGPTKLSEMLTLPEKDYQYITENTTKEQIRELKEFNKHEAEYMNPPEDARNEAPETGEEPPKTEETGEELHETAQNSEEPQKSAKNGNDDPSGSGILIKCLHDFLKKEENKRKFEKCLKAVDDVDAFAKALNPSGSAMLKSGRYMLFLRKPGEMNPMKILGGSPSEYTWEEVQEAFFDAFDGFGSWEEAFAPAQQKKEEPEKADIQSEEKDTDSEENEEKQGFFNTPESANPDKQSDTADTGNEENEENTKAVEVVNAEDTDKQSEGNTIKVTKSIGLCVEETRESAKELKNHLEDIPLFDETTNAARLEDVIKRFQELTVAFLCNLQDWKKAAEKEDL